MAETAAHLLDRVFPIVPVRQWVVVGLGMGGPAGGDLYLDLAVGYVPSASLSNDIVRKSASPIGNGVHGFYPQRTKMQTVWFVAGPGVAAGKSIGGMRQIDIAPTLSYLLSIPIPRNAKGHIIGEALAAERKN